MEADHWLGVELRHFLALEAVAREGSFGRAAKALGYTQSAVSQQIAALERIVGQRLVERPGGPKPVSLTEAGRLLLTHADAIAARVAAAPSLSPRRGGERRSPGPSATSTIATGSPTHCGSTSTAARSTERRRAGSSTR